MSCYNPFNRSELFDGSVIFGIIWCSCNCRLYGAVMCDEKAYGYDPDVPASAPAEED